LHPFLQELVDYILTRIDISLISGFRNKQEQDEAFDVGVTTLRWPDSKHNKLPSMAVDLQPYPYPKDEGRLRAALGYIAGIAVEYARARGKRIRWGGDWNENGDLTDQLFDDLFHLELIE
jgi:hypothetical protein